MKCWKTWYEIELGAKFLNLYNFQNHDGRELGVNERNVIYMVHRPFSKQVYIGQTKDEFFTRMESHIRNARDPNKHKCKFTYALSIELSQFLFVPLFQITH